MPVIALIDGEHHPDAVRELLDSLDLAGVIFCGGEEKLGLEPLEERYGRPVETDPEAGLRRLAARAEAVVDLADEPVLPPRDKLRLAALALHLGLRYEAPGLRLDPPDYERVPFDGPKLAVIATGKRTGKTALACHLARLLREHDPVIVCMGRGGPERPVVAEPSTSLDDLLAIADRGAHAASDYLEDAVLAGVRTVGCRRVGGGLAGAPAESNVPEGGALAASLDTGLIVFEGSGSCIPPVEVDRTACIVGPGEPEPFADYRMLRADLLLAQEGTPAPPAALRFELRPEPAEPLPEDARVALFTTGAPRLRRRRSGGGLGQPGSPRGARRRHRPRRSRGLRRLAHRAQGRGDRHGRQARAGRGRPRRVRAQPPGGRRPGRGARQAPPRCPTAIARRSSSARATGCPTRRA